MWSDNLETIIPTCRDFEENLIRLVWNLRLTAPTALPIAGDVTPHVPSTSPPSIGTSSDVQLNETIDEKKEHSSVESPTTAPVAKASAKPKSEGSLWGWRLTKKSREAESDLEKGSGASARPMRFFAPVYGGLAAALSICKCRL